MSVGHFRTFKARFSASKCAEWELTNISIVTLQVVYDDKGYVDIVYTILLRRYSLYYIITLYMPTYLIVAMGIVGLFTPSTNLFERTER